MQAPTIPFDPSPFAAVFDTVAAAKLSAPPVIVQMISTRGFKSVGDLGQASYMRVASASAVAIAAGLAFQTADGTWWLLAHQGTIWVEQAGLAADCPVWSGNAVVHNAPAGVTDNSPLLMALMQFAMNAAPQGGSGGSMVEIRFSNCIQTMGYYFSQPIQPPCTVNLRGTTTALNDGTTFGVTLLFAPDTNGIIFNHRLTQPSGYTSTGTYGSRIKGFRLMSGGGTNRTAHGLWHRTVLFFDDLIIDSFPGNGYNNVGYAAASPSLPTFGLTSHSRGCNVTIVRCGNVGWYVDGSDVSASQFDNIQVVDARTAGFIDNGAFCNTYNNAQCNGHNYGLTGACQYSGRQYQLISITAGIGATTTPGTNAAVWEDMGALAAPTAKYPAWSSANTYEMSAPFYAGGPSKISGYMEQYFLSCIGRNGAEYYGTWTPSRYTTYHGPFGTSPGKFVTAPVASYRLAPPPFTTVGARVMNQLGNYQTPYNETVILSTSCDGHNGFGNDYMLYYGPNGNINWGYRAGAAGFPDVYSITGFVTNVGLGTLVPQPHFFTTTRFALGDPTVGATSLRQMQMGSAVPTAGTYALGHTIFNIAPTPNGPTGWRCTTGGSITTTAWAASTAYKVGSLVNNGGNCYIAVMPAARAAATAYNVGDIRSNANCAWQCTVAGTTDVAGSSGPVKGAAGGASTNLVDGTCQWSLTTSFTSAASGGPTGGGASQDGQVTWQYQPAFVFSETGRRDLAPFTKATLPSAAANPRLQVWVSDDANGAQPAVSDGTTWRRVQDQTAVA